MNQFIPGNQPHSPHATGIDPFASDPTNTGVTPNSGTGENGGDGEHRSYLELLLAEFVHWAQTEGTFWAVSFGIHSVLMTLMMFIGSSVASRMNEAPVAIEEAEIDLGSSEPIDSYIFTQEIPQDDFDMNVSLTAIQNDQEEIFYTDENVPFEMGGATAVNTNPIQSELWSSGALDLSGLMVGGPAVASFSEGISGKGGKAESFEGYGPNSKGDGIGDGRAHQPELVGAIGGTGKANQVVAGGLNWIARHQMPDGTWRCNQFPAGCSCTIKGSADYVVGATALGVLPFLAANITGEGSNDPQYQAAVKKGITALTRMQDPQTGAIKSSDGNGLIYGHSLATIALCEAYAMTGSGQLRDRAQAALMYMEYAQDQVKGGWRYSPRSDSDTSVTGWALMALQSGRMAGLSVNQRPFDEARRYLQSVSAGPYKNLYGYTDSTTTRPSMTAAGLLCMQYLGEPPDGQMMAEGRKYLLENKPGIGERNVYYIYYAAQVMHNTLGPEWDDWNRAMRSDFAESQIKEGCSLGSWDLTLSGDSHIRSSGGRLVGTSLAVLSMEVYYRHLPLFKLNKEDDQPAAPAPATTPSAKEDGDNE